MNAPVLTYRFNSEQLTAFAELDVVRLLVDAETDDGDAVPAGTRGTVVAVWGDGAAYEVEVDAGLVTALPAQLAMA